MKFNILLAALFVVIILLGNIAYAISLLANGMIYESAAILICFIPLAFVKKNYLYGLATLATIPISLYIAGQSYIVEAENSFTNFININSPLVSHCQSIDSKLEEKIESSCVNEYNNSKLDLVFSAMKAVYLSPLLSLADANYQSTKPHKNECGRNVEEFKGRCPIVYEALSKK